MSSMSPGSLPDAAVAAGWKHDSFSAAGITHETYRKGVGPGVVVVHEIPASPRR